jgi:hypothetical protein
MAPLPGKIFRWVFGVGVGAAAWLLFALGAVPQIITSAYNRESLEIFNQLLAAAGSRPLAEYLDKWQKITWGGLSFILLAASIPILIWYWPSIVSRVKRNPGLTRLLRPELIVILFTAGMIVLAVLLYFLAPVAYVTFITEDYWMEYGTVAAYLMAAGFLGYGMVKYKALRRLVPLLLFAWALFNVGDEISWGQRIIGFSTPEFFVEYNQQAEFNLHNFLSFSNLSYAVLGLGLVAWALPLSWGIRHLPILRGFSEKLGLPSISPVLVPLFLAAGLFFMLPLLNLLPKADEIAEFLLAVSIAGLALDQLITLQPADVRESSGASWLGFFAYLSVLTVILVVFFPTPEMLQSRLNNFAAQVYPRNGLPGQAQTIFLYLQSHPEMQTERTPLNHARFLMRQGDLEGAKALLDEQLALHRAEILAADGNLQRRRYLAELDAAAAEVNFLLGNIPLAAEYINEALTLDSELAVPENLKNLVP